jgi:ABC-2 type transport system ATP-binding protein
VDVENHETKERDVANILKTTDITKCYGEQKAVDRVSLTVRQGEVYGLVGQNGAGKTTLIRMVAGLTEASGGQIELMGQHAPHNLVQARRHIGSIIETPAFYPNLNARDNLECYRLQYGIPERNCVRRMLALVGLQDTGKKRFRDFSLGMKQRLGLALALLNNPDLLLLDEPINGLDPTGIVEIRELIKRLSAQGITILISSHILTEMAQVATCYGFIHQGRLLLEIGEKELAEQCRRSLHITVSDTAPAVTVLERILNPEDLKVINATELRVYGYQGDPAELVKLLFEAGVAVSGLTQIGDSLEDFFTDLIGGRNA